MKTRKDRYTWRKIRTRKNILGTHERPRLSVYRSLKHIYAQIIDDIKGKTLAASSSHSKGFEKCSGVEAAKKIGVSLGEKAKAKGIKQVVFDRGARVYTGQVKAVAEGAREAGLKF